MPKFEALAPPGAAAPRFPGIDGERPEDLHPLAVVQRPVGTHALAENREVQVGAGDSRAKQAARLHRVPRGRSRRQFECGNPLRARQRVHDLDAQPSHRLLR